MPFKDEEKAREYMHKYRQRYYELNKERLKEGHIRSRGARRMGLVRLGNSWHSPETMVKRLKEVLK
jgi:hypothetical protein